MFTTRWWNEMARGRPSGTGGIDDAVTRLHDDTPVFVLTHHPRPSIEMNGGGTSLTRLASREPAAPSAADDWTEILPPGDRQAR
jgi:hypothetical protein